MQYVLGERREELERFVDEILEQLDAGGGEGIVERAAVDLKEEAGRRVQGVVQPGNTTNDAAATKLADEVCCMANTPGGGALVLGVDDKTKDVIGTELDDEWLRNRIYSAVEVAPQIDVRTVAGQRLLVIYVAESPEPVEDTSGRLRWRVADRCVPTDRSEWWVKREASGGLDEMARSTAATFADVTAGAIRLARSSILSHASNELPEDSTDEDVLRSAGAIRPDGSLTQAARLLLCPANIPLLTLTTVSVKGGDVELFYEGRGDESLLEQLSSVEGRLDTINRSTVVKGAFVEQRVRDIPPRALREAILNGLIHRDWNTAQPTQITWELADSTLVVKSPGGFSGGLTERDLLNNQHARYPALADLFRALRLVEKQGLGVDRMYQSMIALGHRPPHIVAGPGPSIVCTLIGGKPVVPVLALIGSIRPEVRQTDVRVAIIVDALLRRPFLTLEEAKALLQADEFTARVALQAAASSTIESEPLVREYRGVWLFGSTAFSRAKRARSGSPVELMRHATTDRSVADEVVDRWLNGHDYIVSADLMEIMGISRPTANTILQEMTADKLTEIGAGRSVRYLRT